MSAPKIPCTTGQLIRECESGASIADLAIKYGVCRQAIYSRFRAYGYDAFRKRQSAHPTRRQPRQCATCGVEFMPSRAEQRHCSYRCVKRLGIHMQTHCKHGHPLVEGNLTKRTGKTPPRCKLCVNTYQLTRYHAQKAAQQ